MFEQWLENLKMLIGEDDKLPPLDELRRLFERGLSEEEALSELAGTPAFGDE